MYFRRRTYWIWIALSLLLWANIATPLLAYQLPTNGYPKLEINGSNTLSVNVNKTEGSQASFNDYYYGENKTFTNSTNLYMHGELYKDLFLDASVMVDQFTPSNTRWTLQYKGNDAHVTLGEFTASLGNNEFVLLNRFLRGVQVDAVLPKGSLTAVTSQLKAPVKTDSFYGQNITGPYFLTSAPVVEGSEVVMVNNVRKERGTHYYLDYVSGQLNFSSGIIIGPADLVTVSYEVGSGGAGNGTLVAMRGSYPITDKLNVGISRLQVNGRNATSSEQEKEEIIQGTGSVAPIHLNYRPIVEDSETITVNLRPLVRGQDYKIDYKKGTIEFINGAQPPLGVTVKVVYRVIVADTGGSDRSVTGVDVDWQVAKGLRVNAQAAKSEGGGIRVISPEKVSQTYTVTSATQVFTLERAPIQQNSVKIISSLRPSAPLVADADYRIDYETGRLELLGTLQPSGFLTVSYTTAGRTVRLQGDSAMALTTSYDTGKLKAQVKYRTVDPGFAPLETVGFRQTDSALEWSGNYSLSDAITFGITGDNTRQPYNPYAVGAGSEIMMDERNRAYTVSYNKQNRPQVTLQHTTRNAEQVGSDSLGNATTTDSLMMTWVKNGISAGMNLNRTSTDSRQLQSSFYSNGSDADTSIFSYKGTTNTASMYLNYQPNEKMNVGVNLATNSIDSESDGVKTKSGGSNLQANAMYKVSDAVTLNANLQSSKTDAVTNASGVQAPAVANRNMSVGANWKAAHNLSMDVRLSQDRYEGDEYSSSTSNTMSASALWQASKWASLNGYWFTQDLKYLTEESRSRSNMVGVSTELGPIGKARVNLDAQHVWGESVSAVSQLSQMEGQSRLSVQSAPEMLGAPTVTGNNITTLSGKVTYPIANKQEVFVSGKTERSSGLYSNSTTSQNTVGLGWNYHLNDNMTFTLNARRIMGRDQENANNNFNTNQLNAQMSFSF